MTAVSIFAISALVLILLRSAGSRQLPRSLVKARVARRAKRERNEVLVLLGPKEKRQAWFIFERGLPNDLPVLGVLGPEEKRQA